MIQPPLMELLVKEMGRPIKKFAVLVGYSWMLCIPLELEKHFDYI